MRVHAVRGVTVGGRGGEGRLRGCGGERGGTGGGWFVVWDSESERVCGNDKDG